MTNEKTSKPTENLRRLWEEKKQDGTTQLQAAKKLGWTQGAFSQYLNNITELNPLAVLKLANFFGVPPEHIDPSIRTLLNGKSVNTEQLHTAVRNLQSRFKIPSEDGDLLNVYRQLRKITDRWSSTHDLPKSLAPEKAE